MESDVFGAIAAPVRREILQMLAREDMPVTRIAESFEMTLSAVSQHLSILKEANLVTISKQGRQRIYRLTPEPLNQVTEWIAQYEQFWALKLGRLENYLEENIENT